MSDPELTQAIARLKAAAEDVRYQALHLRVAYWWTFVEEEMSIVEHYLARLTAHLYRHNHREEAFTWAHEIVESINQGLYKALCQNFYTQRGLAGFMSLTTLRAVTHHECKKLPQLAVPRAYARRFLRALVDCLMRLTEARLRCFTNEREPHLLAKFESYLIEESAMDDLMPSEGVVLPHIQARVLLRLLKPHLEAHWLQWVQVNRDGLWYFDLPLVKEEAGFHQALTVYRRELFSSADRRFDYYKEARHL